MTHWLKRQRRFMVDFPKPEPEAGSDGDGEPEDIPALFATIHFRGPLRPNGYTLEELDEINSGLANRGQSGKRP